MKYIGIDIGKKSCSACIKDAAGKIVHEIKYPNTVHDAEMLIKDLPRGRYAAVCESTGNMWLKTYETLEKHKIPVTLANPLKTKAIASAMVKTDKIDRIILADLLRADLIPACHVPDRSIRMQKEILRRRSSLVIERTRTSNRLSALLDKHDIAIETQRINAKKTLHGLSLMKFEGYDNDLVQQSIHHINYLNDQIRDVEKIARKIVTDNDDARLIMSMTGFDYLGALLIALEIDDIRRFPNAKKIVSWMGLVPTVHQSGNVEWYGKMRKDTNRHVNSTMIQAAGTASRTDKRMKKFYKKFRKKHPYGVAVSHVAHKMGIIIWYILRDHAPYRQRNEELYSKKILRVTA